MSRFRAVRFVSPWPFRLSMPGAQWGIEGLNGLFFTLISP
jgi:hypothetical protein